MTPVEIDRRLALVIGYRPEDVTLCHNSVEVLRASGWWVFDHQDVEVIYPIAEHFKMMPQWSEGDSKWLVRSPGNRIWTHHTNPRTCIALAVIEAAERGLLK
jgi:hypothetical protein